jgi:hypothetical protein
MDHDGSNERVKSERARGTCTHPQRQWHRAPQRHLLPSYLFHPVYCMEHTYALVGGLIYTLYRPFANGSGRYVNGKW